MTKLQLTVVVLTTATMVLGQRPSFAGSRPIGYPALATSAPASADELGNRFGDENNGTSTPSTTTQRLPIEANGDRDLINRLSKLPVDSQPFWFINWQALEAHRRNPQTYPQRPNPFGNQPVNVDGVNMQAQADSGSLNRNGNLGFNSGINSQTQSNSNTRNVDVSGLTNNNALLGGVPSPVRDNSNNVRIETPNEVQNANSPDPLANRYDDEPIENTNPTSLPDNTPLDVSTSSGNPSPSEIFPDTFYPNFEPQTRWYPSRSQNSGSHRTYDFVQPHHISMPQGYRRFDRSFYYL